MKYRLILSIRRSASIDATFAELAKKLGRLEIDAVNRLASPGAPSEWRLNRLAIANPEATFTATGNWAAVGASAAPGTAGKPSYSTEQYEAGLASNSDQAAGNLATKMSWNPADWQRWQRHGGGPPAPAMR